MLSALGVGAGDAPPDASKVGCESGALPSSRSQSVLLQEEPHGHSNECRTG